MDKKLPKIFANQINEPNVNEKTFYSVNERTARSDPKKVEGANIYQKINNIFNSRNYVYKANVIIKTRDWESEKIIIGKNNGNLITIDNELIPISNIIDIYQK